MKPKVLLLLFVVCMVVASCSDDEPAIPSDAIALNMMNENNGRTFLGQTDVYINEADNFFSENCSIVNLGHAGSMNNNPSFGASAQEMAVIPGNFYQILVSGSIEEVGGGNAYPVNVPYYCVYVDSWLLDSNRDRIGAQVVYLERYPMRGDLPEWDALISLTLKNVDGTKESASVTFPKGSVIDEDYEIDRDGSIWDLSEHLEVTVKGNTASFSNTAYIPGGSAEVRLKVRKGNIFTRVRMNVSTGY